MEVISQHLLQDQIPEMMQETGKLCISIILPIQANHPDYAKHISRVVNEVADKLIVEYGDDALQLSRDLREAVTGINLREAKEGLGIYASENILHAIHFPFPVKERVIIDRLFDIRDILYAVQLSRPYFVLHLSGHGAQLFAGEMNDLMEVIDGNFPMEYADSYEYSRPSRGTSYSGNALLESFEDDPSHTEKKRLGEFLLQADKKLHAYLLESEMLFLSGVKRNISAFLNRSSHGNRLAGIIPGNYEHSSIHQFSGRVWPAVTAFLREEVNEAISDLEEKNGEGLTESDLINIWSAVAEGRGAKLLVEKDFSLPGYIVKNASYQLYLQPPARNHRVLHDAVNALIAMTLEKDGQIIITENGMLAKYQHIALITRY